MDVTVHRPHRDAQSIPPHRSLPVTSQHRRRTQASSHQSSQRCDADLPKAARIRPKRSSRKPRTSGGCVKTYRSLSRMDIMTRCANFCGSVPASTSANSVVTNDTRRHCMGYRKPLLLHPRCQLPRGRQSYSLQSGHLRSPAILCEQHSPFQRRRERVRHLLSDHPRWPRRFVLARALNSPVGMLDLSAQ
jgi:hypothetical protein